MASKGAVPRQWTMLWTALDRRARFGRLIVSGASPNQSIPRRSYHHVPISQMSRSSSRSPFGRQSLF